MPSVHEFAVASGNGEERARAVVTSGRTTPFRIVPLDTAVADQLRSRLLALRGYDVQQTMVAAEVIDGKAMEGLLDDLLARPDVAYVHVRYARAGCFACAIERA